MKFERLRVRRASPKQPGDMSYLAALLFVLGGAAFLGGIGVLIGLAWANF